MLYVLQGSLGQPGVKGLDGPKGMQVGYLLVFPQTQIHLNLNCCFGCLPVTFHAITYNTFLGNFFSEIFFQAFFCFFFLHFFFYVEKIFPEKSKRRGEPRIFFKPFQTFSVTFFSENTIHYKSIIVVYL